MRARSAWNAIRGGDTVARIRSLRDGQAALRLGVGAAGLRTGVLDALLDGPTPTAEVASRIGTGDVALLEAFLHVLQAAGHVRFRGAQWSLSRRTTRALDDDLVRAAYAAFSGYHTGLYRTLHEQLRGAPARRDIWDCGELIARLSAAFEPFVADVLTRTIRQRRPARVLDVGCGAGLQLATMLEAAPGTSGIGIELDPDAASLANETLEKRGLAHRASVLIGDFASVTAGGTAGIGGPADFALVANVIYYLPVPSRAMFFRRLAALLTADGAILVVTTAATPGLASRHFDLLLRAQEGDLELPDLHTLREQLREAGLAPGDPTRIAPGEPLFALLATRDP